MAQTGYTPIQLYRTTTAAAAPLAANLNPGELAININDADMALYAENQSGTVKRLMNNPAGLKYPTADGTANQIIKTDGAGNLTFVTPGTGTVTSVTGTAPVVSSGGATPAISMAAATTSVNGYLTSTDWTTFNGKYSTGGALGTPSSGTLSSCTVDGTNGVGYKNIPLSGIKTASYTLVAGDVGKFIELGTSGSVVVPASVFAAGDAISIFNNTSASISCTCSAVTTVYKGGTDADISSFSVTTRGVATILFITATVAVITGNLA